MDRMDFALSRMPAGVDAVLAKALSNISLAETVEEFVRAQQAKWKPRHIVCYDLEQKAVKVPVRALETVESLVAMLQQNAPAAVRSHVQFGFAKNGSGSSASTTGRRQVEPIGNQDMSKSVEDVGLVLCSDDTKSSGVSVVSYFRVYVRLERMNPVYGRPQFYREGYINLFAKDTLAHAFELASQTVERPDAKWQFSDTDSTTSHVEATMTVWESGLYKTSLVAVVPADPPKPGDAIPMAYVEIPAGPYEVSVKSLSGQTLAMAVEASDTVENLKQKVYDVSGVPCDQQRLVYSGLQLEDGRTMLDYCVGPNAVLHMILRLRGGMMHSTSGRHDFAYYTNSPLATLCVVQFCNLEPLVTPSDDKKRVLERLQAQYGHPTKGPQAARWLIRFHALLRQLRSHISKHDMYSEMPMGLSSLELLQSVLDGVKMKPLEAVVVTGLLVDFLC